MSTRVNPRRAETKTFSEILLEGLAPDGGLYVPVKYPSFSLSALRGQSYLAVAQEVMSRFAPEIPLRELQSILEATYTKECFGSEEITPIKMLKPGLGLLKLSNGPTLAFKDLPLQLLGRLIERELKKNGKTINILGATSGDTGSAAEYALRGRKGIKLFMLSPRGRMSEFQERQMYTINDPNIFNILIDGTFDDCQALVKAVNADEEFKNHYKIGAINSINWARIAAQVVYWVYGYLRATKSDSEHITFVVPSGNFGNAFSAYVARLMGLPIDIVVAANENDVLDEFFRTGVYRVRKGNEVKRTSSPSMDIASASNLERLVFELMRNSSLSGMRVQAMWKYLQEKGQLDARSLMQETGVGRITSGSATDADVIETIRKIADLGTIIDPHTAVGVHVALKRPHPYQKVIVAETAQPAKFAATIKEAIGYEPPVPKAFANLGDLPQYTSRVPRDVESLKQFISARA